MRALPNGDLLMLEVLPLDDDNIGIQSNKSQMCPPAAMNQAVFKFLLSIFKKLR